MGYSCLLKINFLAIYNVVFIIESQWTILQKILLCKFLFSLLGSDSVTENSVLFFPDLHDHLLQTGSGSSQGRSLPSLAVTGVKRVPRVPPGTEKGRQKTEI